jgi:MoaA/NifB/PqqE/SkfB family radical SAM enzyme
LHGINTPREIKVMIDLHKNKNLNLETGISCTLQCPDCARTIRQKPGGPGIPGKNLNLNQFSKLARFFKEIHFCGGWSDPIFNPDFISMLKICQTQNVDAYVHTAASHKPKKWYEEAFDANKNAVWRFGIDGLPEESHTYRVNQDGVKLFKMMLLAASKEIKVEWQYLIFEYNKKSIEKAKKLAKTYNLPLLLIDTPRNSKINKNA